MMNINPVSATDFYKTGHIFQYPEGTTLVYSNGACRSDKHFKGLPDFDHKVVNFGLQGICQWLLIDYWNAQFFNQPKKKVVQRYRRTIAKALNNPNFDVKHIEALHDLGYLPVTIKALPEGARVNIKVPTYTIYNTHDDFFWLTNYLETQIQSESWKCKVAATTAFEYRRLFTKYAIDTGVDLSFVDFQGHDFSMRGMSGIQDATQCGAGHLLSFKGTDTVPAIEFLEDYYQGMGGYILKEEDNNTNKKLEKTLDNLYKAGVKNVVTFEETGVEFYEIYNSDDFGYGLESIADPNMFIGGSVPATEHAVQCMSGKDGELGLFERLITTVYPAGIVSIVSDTWDFWQVITDYTVKLKPQIMARDGKVVFRPDSGDPVDIICGTAKDLNNIDHIKDANDAKAFAQYNAGYTCFTYDGKYYEVTNPEAPRRNWYYVVAEPTPEMKGAVECLWEIFGGTETITDITESVKVWPYYKELNSPFNKAMLYGFDEKLSKFKYDGKVYVKKDGDYVDTPNEVSFKTIDSHVGLIYGDSINLDRAQRILEGLKAKGFSSANIVFGIGSFTYQFVTRDTMGEAVKATFGIVNGEEREIFKAPKTGDGMKNSAKGLLRVEYDEKTKDYILHDQQTWDQEETGALTTLFTNSTMVRLDSLDNMRNRLYNSI